MSTLPEPEHGQLVEDPDLGRDHQVGGVLALGEDHELGAVGTQ
jgi:hypothetical protein